MLHGAEGRCVMVQDFPNANGHGKMYFFFSAWPKRAEQWSRSADGATEGKNQPICHPGSVTRARSSLPDPRIQWRSTVNGSGGEFPACYNKNGAFYIGDKSHEIRAGYTQNTSLSMSKSHFSGSAGDNQFTGQQLFLNYFCVTAFACTRHGYQKSLLKQLSDTIVFRGRRYFSIVFIFNW